MVSCSGSLVQSCCGEGGAPQTHVPGECGELSPSSGHTGVAPAHGCVLWGWRGKGRCRQIALCVGSSHCVPATLGLPLLTGVCSPRLYCSGSRLLYMEQALSCVSFRVLHKSVDSVAPGFCAFPCWSSSGSQELDGRTVPGDGEPYPLRGPSLSFRVGQSGACALCLVSSNPPGRCQPSRISGSLWLETGSLFAVW